MKYHLVWITRYRKPVLRGSITGRVRDLIREICKARDVEILKGHVWAEQVHIVVSVPPHSSLSQLVQWIKGKTSRKMLARSGVGIGFCPTGEGS
jgi:putative transposase